MFRISSPIPTLKRGARRAREQIARGRQRLLEMLGRQLVERTRESVETLSAGGQAAGIEWRPLDRDYLERKQRSGEPAKIGQASGELFRSLNSRITPGGVTVEFTAAHAVHFARRRPLLPDQLPEDWADDLENQVEDWGERILAIEITEE